MYDETDNEADERSMAELAEYERREEYFRDLHDEHEAARQRDEQLIEENQANLREAEPGWFEWMDKDKTYQREQGEKG